MAMTLNKKIDCLLLTGMHRSGIAVMAGCLQLLGVNFGTIRRIPDSSDAKDSSRVNDIAVIHDTLLRDLGCTWDMVGNLPDKWLDSTAASNAKKQIGHFIDSQFSSDSLWAVADPRLCRLMPLWGTILNEKGFNPAFIVTIRHPWEVAQSLKEESRTDVRHAHLLWLALNGTIFNYCRQRPYMVTTNDQLIADPAAVLNDIEDQFGLSFPISLQRQYYRILEFIRPELKHHRLGRRYKSDHHKLPFSSFCWIYEQFCNHNVASRLLAHESSKDDGNALLPTGFHPDALPMIKGPASFQQQSGRHGNQIFQQYLSLIGQYEHEDRELELQKKRRILNTTLASDTLFARLYVPPSERDSQDQDTASDCLLVKGEWQQIRIHLPHPNLLKNRELRFAPLNTKGTVRLSAIRLVNAATGVKYWELNSPSDFKSVQLIDAIRLPDSELFSFLTFSNRAHLNIPLGPEVPDSAMEFQAWMNVDNRQDCLAVAWSYIQRKNNQLRSRLEKANQELEKGRLVKKGLNKQIQSVNQTLEMNKAKNSDLENQVALFAKQQAEQQRRIGELEKSLQTALNEKRIYKEKQNTLVKELESSKEVIGELEKELEAGCDMQKRLREEVETTKQRATDGEIHINTLQEKLTHRNGQITRLKTELAEIKSVSTIEMLKNRLANLKKYLNPRFLIKRTPKDFAMASIFDRQWYLRTYSSIIDEGVNPLKHYLVTGYKKGCNPNPLFLTQWYLETYPDVAEAGVNPLNHYLEFGFSEGRDPNPLFDTDWYLETYPDVAEAKANPLAHYIVFGVNEGRDPNPLFDTDWYLETYPNVVESGMNPLAHYLQYGCRGDHNPNPFFDGRWYLKSYIAPSDTDTNPLTHYLYVGINAGYVTAPPHSTIYGQKN